MSSGCPGCARRNSCQISVPMLTNRVLRTSSCFSSYPFFWAGPPGPRSVPRRPRGRLPHAGPGLGPWRTDPPSPEAWGSCPKPNLGRCADTRTSGCERARPLSQLPAPPPVACVHTSWAGPSCACAAACPHAGGAPGHAKVRWRPCRGRRRPSPGSRRVTRKRARPRLIGCDPACKEGTREVPSRMLKFMVPAG